eukprot:m.109552 g.109552  ORF g.109552 m.109552 type:complete len:168 (+) comp37345_c0_seq1:890-1393(+)
MLSFKANDIIEILSSADDGKWYGEINHHQGFFYMSFTDYDNISWQGSGEQEILIQPASVIRDYFPRKPSAFLPVKVDDFVLVLAMPANSLFTAELNGQVGYVYSNHLQLQPGIPPRHRRPRRRLECSVQSVKGSKLKRLPAPPSPLTRRHTTDNCYCRADYRTSTLC